MATEIGRSPAEAGSGCQPTASAADASSQSGIPNAFAKWDRILEDAYHAFGNQFMERRAELNATRQDLREFGATVEALTEALQQFVNGVETRMIDSPADETLANITNRARKALAKARGEQPDAYMNDVVVL